MIQKFSTALLALASVAGAPAQEASAPAGEDFFVEGGRFLHVWNGENAGDQFGWVASPVGDADGDGVLDLFASAPFWKDGGKVCGRVYLYSGADGSLIRQHTGAVGDLLGLSVSAAGDLDRDGHADYAASATEPRGGPGRVLIWSGRTGRVLRTLTLPDAPEDAVGWNFGRELADLGDWDGDGWPDLAVTAPQADTAAGEEAGLVQIRSGRDGSVLLQRLGATAGGHFGSCVTGRAGRGDRPALLAVGAMDDGEAQQGVVHVFHGVEAVPAFAVRGDASNVNFGRFFASVPGDVDGDGRDDLYLVDFEAGGGDGDELGARGEVRVVSGVDGRLIHRLRGQPGDGLGIGDAAAGDVDGDGCADLAVGAWTHRSAAPAAGRVTLYSGRTGAPLRTWTCKTAQETFGFDAIGIGDLDDDGHTDFLVTGAWSAVGGPRTGRVYVVAGG